MADKLIACTCGGQGVTIDAEPPQREVEWCKKHGCEPRRHYAVRCDKCGKQTQSYTIKTPAWKDLIVTVLSTCVNSIKRNLLIC